MTATANSSPMARLRRRRMIPSEKRGQLVVLATLLVLTAAAWALTVHQARTMDMPMGVAVRGTADSGMDGMTAVAMAGAMGGDWTVGAATGFLVAWTAMMAAMMLPAAAPMVLFFRTVSSGRHARGHGFVPTWLFVAGYLVVWSAVSATTYAAVQLGGDLAARLDAADRTTWAPVALGLTVAGAGLYQLTPLKRVCLRHCQSPLGFVMSHWRDGWLGALGMGIRHGAVCLGCCWALFAMLVAAGVMSLAWMLLLTLVIFAEKVLPGGQRTATIVGGSLILVGGLVAAGAFDLPWIA